MPFNLKACRRGVTVKINDIIVCVFGIHSLVASGQSKRTPRLEKVNANQDQIDFQIHLKRMIKSIKNVHSPSCK